MKESVTLVELSGSEIRCGTLITKPEIASISALSAIFRRCPFFAPLHGAVPLCCSGTALSSLVRWRLRRTFCAREPNGYANGGKRREAVTVPFTEGKENAGLNKGIKRKAYGGTVYIQITVK